MFFSIYLAQRFIHEYHNSERSWGSHSLRNIVPTYIIRDLIEDRLPNQLDELTLQGNTPETTEGRSILTIGPDGIMRSMVSGAFVLEDLNPQLCNC